LEEVIVLTGHLGEKIHEYAGDGSRFGLKIQARRESSPLGTAGCLGTLSSKMDDDFILLYGDVILDVNLSRFTQFHRRKNGLASLLVHPNDHPEDSDRVEIDENGGIVRFLSKKMPRGPYFDNLVNAALYVLSPQVFDYITPVFSDFVEDIFPKILNDKKPLFAYRSPEYIKDAGTPERIARVSEHLNKGLISRKNLRHPQKAIFLDRDGTINKEVQLLSKVEQLHLLPRVGQAIRKINCSEYLAVCVTNQPVIARNLCDFDELRRIHQKLSALLARENAFLDRLYFCPHHPDKGYPEERGKYKVDCDCRKPKPGMVVKAAEEMNIDVTRSYMIGDRSGDMALGHRLGMKTVLVKTGCAGEDGQYAAKPDLIGNDLLEAVDFILNRNDH